MTPRARHIAFSATACAALMVARSSTHSSPRREPVARPQPSVTQQDPGRGERWLRNTRAALDAPKRVRLPSVELGDLASAGADAFAFEALAGQSLEITLVGDATQLAEPLYVDVFRVVDVLGEALHERLTTLRPNASTLRTRLPSDGAYHVLVQTGASGAGHYAVTLELAPALPFPVVGGKKEAIRSMFGASRDAGRRHHAGVDIFVQRLTPVLAVAAGRAMPREDALGGRTVWLNTPGTSYYYAHLDRVAVREGQRVKIGDVLGYVGNTGNANGMASHLHFGVYRWGKEPIDPLPLLVGQRFEGQASAATADAGS
jgi:murein DD-endopeptidase MepM/ murein hydrolase activator NlpD